jgi:Na+-driven multidrug efflux pump
MEQLYPFVLAIHSVVRWLVLIVGLLAAGKAIAGWLGKRAWLRLDDRLGAMFTGIMDAQFVVGLLLYVVFSPLTRAGFANFGAAMQEPTLRFFLVEHMPMMVAAVVLTHVGRALSRRAADDAKKHQRAALFFSLAMLAVLVGIPWPFLAYGRPLNPFHMFGG